MAIKQAFHNPNLPDFRQVFSWGLKVTGFSEFFLVTGHGDCDPDFITHHPGDPVAQTQRILEQMETLISQANYSIDDIVRTDWTFTNDVTDQQFSEIADIWQHFLRNIDVKPATGTLRYVQRLGMKDMMVEYELMLAK